MRLLLTLLFCSSTLAYYAQTNWLHGYGGLNHDELLDIEYVDSDQLYGCGYFSNSINMGGTTLTSSGLSDIFICKFDDAGDISWATKAGGTGPDRGQSLAVEENAIYITGSFKGTANFGTISVTANAGSQDIFIAKLDDSGDFEWVKTYGTSNTDNAFGIDIHPDGGIVITGQFLGTIDFDGTSFTSGTDPDTSTQTNDVFILKMDEDGVLDWARQGTSDLSSKGTSIKTDASGNVYTCGEHSGDITFDTTYDNEAENAGFLIKHNSSGTQQWFRQITASQVHCTDLDVNNAGDIFVTGYYAGQCIIETSPIYSIDYDLTNSVFVFKFTSSGAVSWDTHDGSDEELSSNAIDVVDGDGIYIAGTFRCVFADLSAAQDEGIFNSMGFKDVFVSKFALADGTRAWERHFAGPDADLCEGIAGIHPDMPIIGGAFQEYFHVPSNDDFVEDDDMNSVFIAQFPFGFNYCDDINYNDYISLESAGSKDIFISSPVDLTRSVMDIYDRGVGSCDRPYREPEIQSFWAVNDTITSCVGVNLSTNTHTGTLDQIAPNLSYEWSNGSSNDETFINTEGWIWCTFTREDGCWSTTDSVYLDLLEAPPIPLITDNQGVNFEAPPNAEDIVICLPDSAILTASNIDGTTAAWNGGTLLNDSTIFVQESGTYIFTVVNSAGCLSTNEILVQVLDPVLQAFDPLMDFALSDGTIVTSDTITMCGTENFYAVLYDLDAEEYGYLPNGTVTWSVDPDVESTDETFDPLEQEAYFEPTESGWYTIQADLVVRSECSDSVVYPPVVEMIYIELLEAPEVSVDFEGETVICPGDSTLVTVSGADTYEWFGNAVLSQPDETSAWLTLGSVIVQGTTIYSNGCEDSDGQGITVSTYPGPTITSNPGSAVICPGDSVWLQCQPSPQYTWIGPLGNIISEEQGLFVFEPGAYTCIVTNAAGCELSSNVIDVLDYNAPYLLPDPGTELCVAGEVTLFVITNDGSAVWWDDPLNIGSLEVSIDEPGTYVCNVQMCNITTELEVEVTQNIPEATAIAAEDILCPGDSVLLSANGNMDEYVWMPGNLSGQEVYVSSPGTYTLTTFNAFGCSNSDDVVLASGEILGAPEDQFFEECNDQIIAITNDFSGLTQWYDENGTLVFSGSTYNLITAGDQTLFISNVSNDGCNSPFGTITIETDIPEPPSSLLPDTLICSGENLYYNLDPNIGDVVWDVPFGDVNGNALSIENITPQMAGFYNYTLSTPFCFYDNKDFELEVVNVPRPLLGDQSVDCFDDLTVIEAAGGYDTYEWSTDETSDFIFPQETGWYILDAFKEPYCFERDSVLVEELICASLLPNIFTPNGDGSNDYFDFALIAAGRDIEKVEVYNRWGNLIRTLSSNDLKWDGDAENGEPVLEGVYYFILFSNENANKASHGYVHVFFE